MPERDPTQTASITYIPRGAEILEVRGATGSGPSAVEAAAIEAKRGFVRAHYVTGSARSHGQIDGTEAILESLHRERSTLLRKRRLSEASDNDLDYLSDLEKYIDLIEARSGVDTSTEVWTKLDDLAARLLETQAQIEQAKRK